MNPNPFADVVAFVTNPVWTTAVFWLLVLASVVIAVIVWNRLPEQRNFSNVVQWAIRLVMGAFWWQQSLWKLPPFYTDHPESAFGETGLAYWMGLMGKHAAIPLFISTDEEGGPWVHRLKNIYGLRKSALDIYNSGDVNVATQEGHSVAHDLLSLGINENLAPDVDVALVNGIDQVTRTFGFTADSVIKFADPYMRAMQSDGIVACIKHYPGLGDANIDAHAGLPIVNRTRDQIYSVELAPFKHFIQTTDPLERPGMIMPTDVLMPAIDPVMPAELSHVFMTDILRKEFGYDGVALTDALYMKGVKVNGASISMPQAALMALNAGNDMLLGPAGAGQMIAVMDGLKEALRNGTLSKARVDEAALRAVGLATGRADGIKILGDGELKKKLTVSARAFSASARAKIESLGGVCEIPGAKKSEPARA